MRLVPVLLAGVAVGVVDLAFAIVFWLVKANVPPIRICQSIARGLLGREAFAGGAGSAALGVVVHFVIALAMALAYAMVASRVRVLVRHWLPCGVMYGGLLYVIMNFVVLPLSAAGKPSFADHLWVEMSIAFHALFGVIIAMGARRAYA
jgi:uncharacterized membrane protein YagU involved in acid resistance